MRPVLITPPAELPVTVADLKQHVRVGHDDDDATLEALIGAATSHIDGANGVLGRCIVTQTWRQDFPAWWGAMRLPFPDVTAITSLTYTDADGAEQTVAVADYRLLNTYAGSELRLAARYSWPTLQADHLTPVSVTFEAGFGAAADVPQAIKVSIMMLAAHWYENREAVAEGNMQEVPLGFDALISPYRVVRL